MECIKKLPHFWIEIVFDTKIFKVVSLFCIIIVLDAHRYGLKLKSFLHRDGTWCSYILIHINCTNTSKKKKDIIYPTLLDNWKIHKVLFSTWIITSSKHELLNFHLKTIKNCSKCLWVCTITSYNEPTTNVQSQKQYLQWQQTMECPFSFQIPHSLHTDYSNIIWKNGWKRTSQRNILFIFSVSHQEWSKDVFLYQSCFCIQY